MPRALEINIEVGRIDRAVESVRRLSSEVRGVGRSMEGLGGGSRRAAEREFAQFSRSIMDPYETLGAGSRGGGGRRQQSTMDRFTTALRSTRFSAGGISPLVGRTADVLGLPTTGAAGLGVAGAAAAIAALAMAVKAATENLNQFGDAMRLSGGTAGDVAALGGVGLRGGAAASAAAAFVQRISVGGDPMAQMAASRYGLGGRLGRPFGDVNEARTYAQGIQVLRGITNAEERLRTARLFGMEAELKYLDVSPRVNAMLERQAEIEKDIAESQGPRAANDFSVSLETLHQSFLDLGVSLIPAIEGLTNITNQITAFTQAIQRGGNWTDLLAARGRDWLRQNIPGIPDWVAEGIFPVGGGDPRQREKAALDAHTDAMNRHTDAMQDVPLQPGIYGGGAGTGAAAPGGWSGDYLARQRESGALGRGVPIR